jgi:PPM family protein phosphatase
LGTGILATMDLALDHLARTDVGRVRRDNEDAVFGTSRLVAVADGVGGHVAGEVASQVAIGALASLDKCWLEDPLADALQQAVMSGNERIAFVAECRPELSGMGTTLTAVAVDGETLTVANIGDSRTYLFRGGALRQLTRDDSLVQELIEGGRISPEEARDHPRGSLVLKALDGDRSRRPTITTEAARVGDRLLLCSDGLSDMVDDAAISEALRIESREACAERLLRLALDAGGRDNISLVLADLRQRRETASGWRRAA